MERNLAESINAASGLVRKPSGSGISVGAAPLAGLRTIPRAFSSLGSFGHTGGKLGSPGESLSGQRANPGRQMSPSLIFS
jgi:hypothetical protein